MAAIVLMAGAVVASDARTVALVTPVPVPEPVPSIGGLSHVDVTGRFVLGDGGELGVGGRSGGVRYDRLTGAAVELPPVIAVSADLKWAVTYGSDELATEFLWWNIDAGTSILIPGFVPVALSANGQTVLARDDFGTWLLTRSGEVEPAPVTGALPLAMSPSGRWVLFSTPCVPDVGSGCVRYYRWESRVGSLELMPGGATRAVGAIADDGAVLETEWVSGDGFTGGESHVLRFGIDGSRRELIPVGTSMGAEPHVSADASVVAYPDLSGRLVVVDTSTGRRVVKRIGSSDWALSPTGAFALLARPDSRSGAQWLDDVTLVPLLGGTASPKVRAGERVVVPVSGVGSVATDATAVVLNVTVTNPAGPGFATVWPCDRAKPASSNVNVGSAATTVANAVIAKIAGSGSLAGGVCVASSVAAELVIDVQGYFTGSAYTGVTPDRFLDTRNDETDVVPNVAGRQRVVVPVAGVRSVPEDATAVALNVTLTNPSGPGYATVWPCDRPRPDSSNVNVTASGATVANAVIAAVAGDGASAGAVCIWVSTASDVIVDVQGYFTGAAYEGLVPDRFVDTRDGETDGIPNVGAGDVVEVPVAGVGSVPDDVRSVVVNVTATNVGAAGYLTVWPCDQQRPEASNVNMTAPGVTVANAAIATVATGGARSGSICVFTSTDADVIVDVQGYFTGTEYTGLSPARTLDTRG